VKIRFGDAQERTDQQTQRGDFPRRLLAARATAVAVCHAARQAFELASVIETLEYPAISMRICLVQEYRYPDALLGGGSGQKQSCLNVC
jgi:hypothetical protein